MRRIVLWGLLVAALVFVVGWVGTEQGAKRQAARRASQLPVNLSPGAVAKVYLDAWVRQDAETMYYCLDSKTQAMLTLDEFRECFHVFIPPGTLRPTRPFFVHPLGYTDLTSTWIWTQAGQEAFKTLAAKAKGKTVVVPPWLFKPPYLEAGVYYTTKWTIASALGPDICSGLWPSRAARLRRAWTRGDWWREYAKAASERSYNGTYEDYIQWVLDCAQPGGTRAIVRGPPIVIYIGGAAPRQFVSLVPPDVGKLQPKSSFSLSIPQWGTSSPPIYFGPLPLANRSARFTFNPCSFRCVFEGKEWRIADAVEPPAPSPRVWVGPLITIPSPPSSSTKAAKPLAKPKPEAPKGQKPKTSPKPAPSAPSGKR